MKALNRVNKMIFDKWELEPLEEDDIKRAISIGVKCQERYDARMVLLVSAQELGQYLANKYGFEIRRAITAGYIVYSSLSKQYRDEIEFSMRYPRSLSFKGIERINYAAMDGSIEPPMDWERDGQNSYASENEDVYGGNLPLMKHSTVHSTIDVEALNKLQGVAYRIKDIDPKYDKSPLEYKFKREFDGTLPYYFIWQSDGCRTYPVAHQINPQGDDYRKTITLNLYKGEPLTEQGLYWVKIAIANARGLDKKSWSERIEWFENTNLLKVQERFLDEPAMYNKLVREYLSYDGGNWDSMIGIDATASGQQIMSIMSRCLKTAFQSNIVGDTRSDVYTNHNRVMKQLTGIKYERKDTKRAFMTHFYNSVATPREVFGINYNTFKESASKLVPGADSVLNQLNRVWGKLKKHHTISLNIWNQEFKFEQTKLKRYSWSHEGHNFTHQFYQREIDEQYRGLAARIIHFIDGQVALELVKRCPFDVVHIHDKFMVHANNIQAMRQIYREIMIDLYNADVLGQIMSQVGLEAVYEDTLKIEHITCMYALS